jgi:hypothetical protein
MEFEALFFNDEVKCLHVVVQGTHKLVVMGHINYKDHVLIKKRWVSKKMNATAGKFKDEKKGNCQKLFFFVVACCEHFQSFRVHNNMNAMNVINKL